MLVTSTSSSVTQPAFVTVHVRVFAPKAKPETVALGLVGGVKVTAGFALVHAPVPGAGFPAARVVVLQAAGWSAPASA